MGRLTSKLHALVDAEALIESMPEGATLLGDKGFDSNAIREKADEKNIWANIAALANKQHLCATCLRRMVARSRSK